MEQNTWESLCEDTYKQVRLSPSTLKMVAPRRKYPARAATTPIRPCF